MSYVSGGVPTTFWCAIPRDQEVTTGTIISFYCYDNAVVNSAYGYLLVLKTPPAVQDYTTTYYPTNSPFTLSALDATSLDQYRIVNQCPKQKSSSTTDNSSAHGGKIIYVFSLWKHVVFVGSI